ncbi:MAG: DMT family transporter [Thermoguttaceae bacterium]
MSWIYLIIAGLFEVCWAVSLESTNHFRKLWPSIWVLVTMFLSVMFLEWALEKIPIGTGYAAWTGIGVIGTVIFGIYFLSEPISVVRLIFLGMILFGIVGLKLTS